MSCGDTSLTGVITSRSRALLAYLLLHRQTPQPRQRIAVHLWPDSTDPQARTNLRKELSQLRRVLPNADQLLWVDTKTLAWHPDVQFALDVAQFEDAVKMAATDSSLTQPMLEKAVELYRGDLLLDCDDEWIISERDRLQQKHVQVLEQLIALLEAQQGYRSALGYAQQLLQVDPLNESTYCLLMRLHGLSGDRANALQVYHRCMTILREELGVNPSSTTRKLYEQLLRNDESPNDNATAQSPSRPHPSSLRLALPPLVGREREWDVIQQWMNTTADDAPSELLLLMGEPGIGKTRLLEELRETMQTGQVVWGRAFAAEMVRPYGIWIDALRSLALPSTLTRSTELGFLLPEIGQPGTAPPNRSHLFDAVVQLLSEWAQQAPVVVILDDIQWIDEASSALLHYAIRLLHHLPIRFACTVRTAELKENAAVSQVVQTLRRERRLKTLEVHPLNRGQTAALVSNFKAVNTAKLSVEVVDQVFIDSGGNPLFALEVARALLHDSAHGQSTHRDNLEALISDRLQQLDSAAQEFLPWAASLGRSFKPTMVAKVADYPLPQLLAVIEQLEQQAVIRPSKSTGNEMGYDFAHDIVRQVVYRQLSEPRRHLIHWQIAHRLNQQATPDHALAGDIAHHAALGGDHALAASAALLAAQRCLKLFAYAEAATLAQRGIQHCQHLDDCTRIRVHVGLLRVWAIAGVRGDQAAQLEADAQRLTHEASQLGFKDDEVTGLEALWVLYFNQSDFASLEQHSVQAVEISRVSSPATAARLLAYSGTCLAEIGRDMVRAEALLLEAQSLADRVGLQITDIYSGLGGVHFYNGRYTEARALFQQAWHQARAEQDHWRECIYVSYVAMLELDDGNPMAALPYCQEMALVAAKIQGEGSEGAVAAALEALANYTLGQSEAEAILEQAIATLKQLDAKRMLTYVLIGAAEVDLKSNRANVAAMRAKAALCEAQIMNQPSETALAWAILVQSALALGDLEQAIATFEAQQGIDRHSLSARSRLAFDQTLHCMKQAMSQSLQDLPKSGELT
ncbi:MAG: AAA family ATPase [Oscillatoriophycideae cyanobacterium NC_groundwater_1537_Pr4_S-0.65um_50_18]|nr:AAA family ATPase [Oscillatoriophycideae cyanobacterium NC_groundwater_1537_Pr4_S-0.65um_50_18]